MTKHAISLERIADLIKILWHDGLGLSLYAKRLERGRFVWPAANGGTVSISAAQLAYMLDGSIGVTRFTHSGRNARDNAIRSRFSRAGDERL